MRPEVVEEAAAQGVKLIVSVDTGIRAAEVVRRAAELGIDVIVTDHHLPESRTAARARRAESQPAGLRLSREEPVRRRRGLQAGPGAAGRARLAGREAAPRRGIVSEDGRHRHRGRRGAAHGREPHHREARAEGLRDGAQSRACARCWTWPDSPPARAPSARQVAFQIAPRINAAGRMDTAQAVIELFLTADPARARELARSFTSRTPSASRRKPRSAKPASARPVDESAAALVFYGEDWHRGVVGIVASRLVERFHRPVFVLGRNGGRPGARLRPQHPRVPSARGAGIHAATCSRASAGTGTPPA